jgi:tripartite-type tricarboxylate transporter receptor subunit TctC
MRYATLLATLAAATLGWAAGAPAQAQSFPVKPVHIVLPYAAGGLNEIALRTIAADLEQRWKQPIVIEARPGAGGRVAYESVAHAPADGYTVVNVVSTLTTMPALYKDLTFDPQRDFAAVTMFLKYTPWVAIYADVPANNLQEFIAYAKSHPGKINYATQGRGNYQHLLFEIFNASLGLDTVAVHYSGTAPALNGELRGDVQLFSITDSLLPQMQGKARIIATTNDTRLASRPDIPALKETGRFNFVPYSWIGLAVPTGTPADAIDKIAADVGTAVRNPEIAAKILKATGANEIASLTPAEFGAMLKDEFRLWNDWIKRLGIEAQ